MHCGSPVFGYRSHRFPKIHSQIDVTEVRDGWDILNPGPRCRSDDIILVDQLALIVRRIVEGRPPPWLSVCKRFAVTVDGQHLNAAPQRPAAFRALDRIGIVAGVGHAPLSTRTVASAPFRPSFRCFSGKILRSLTF